MLSGTGAGDEREHYDNSAGRGQRQREQRERGQRQRGQRQRDHQS